MSLSNSSQLQTGAEYTFWFSVTGAILGIASIPPTGAEIGAAIQPFSDLSSVSGQIFSDPTGTIITAVTVDAVYSGTSDTVGDMGQKIAAALNSAFLTTNFSFDHADGGATAPSQAGTFSQDVQSTAGTLSTSIGSAVNAVTSSLGGIVKAVPLSVWILIGVGFAIVIFAPVATRKLAEI